MLINAPAAVIIAGWYPDPTDDSLARWWDGTEWSANTRERQPVAPAPADTPAPGEQTRYFSPVPIRTDATLPPIDPYRPVSRRHESQGFVSLGVSTARVNPTRAYTGSVWAIATTPIWTTFIVLGLIFGLGDLYTTSLVSLTSIILFVIVVAFAIHDRRMMLSSMHPTAASPWWMILSPLFYLISRGVHVSRAVGSGWAPLIVFLICSLMPAAVVLAFGTLYSFFLSFIN